MFGALVLSRAYLSLALMKGDERVELLEDDDDLTRFPSCLLCATVSMQSALFASDNVLPMLDSPKDKRMLDASMRGCRCEDQL